jgi:hypothetical protein
MLAVGVCPGYRGWIVQTAVCPQDGVLVLQAALYEIKLCMEVSF